MKLTTHLQLVPRSRKRGSIHSLHHMPSWRRALLVKHRDNITFLPCKRINAEISTVGYSKRKKKKKKKNKGRGERGRTALKSGAYVKTIYIFRSTYWGLKFMYTQSNHGIQYWKNAKYKFKEAVLSIFPDNGGRPLLTNLQAGSPSCTLSAHWIATVSAVSATVYGDMLLFVLFSFDSSTLPS
jgi:hypothetical protein